MKMLIPILLLTIVNLFVVFILTYDIPAKKSPVSATYFTLNELNEFQKENNIEGGDRFILEFMAHQENMKAHAKH